MKSTKGRKITTTHSQGGPRKQERTDNVIQTGPIPSGIISDIYSLDEGLTGDDVNFFPADSGWMHMPHQPIISDRTGNLGSNANPQGIPAFSDTLEIKAFSVGDPI